MRLSKAEMSNEDPHCDGCVKTEWIKINQFSVQGSMKDELGKQAGDKGQETRIKEVLT